MIVDSNGLGIIKSVDNSSLKAAGHRHINCQQTLVETLVIFIEYVMQWIPND